MHAPTRQLRIPLAALLAIALGALVWIAYPRAEIAAAEPDDAPGTSAPIAEGSAVARRSVHFAPPSESPDIRVEVVDISGHSIEAAHVAVLDREPRRWNPEQAEAQTDESGVCSLPSNAVPEASLRAFVVAGKRGWLSASAPLNRDTTHVRLTLERPETITIRVTDPTGAPIRGARFELSRLSQTATPSQDAHLPGTGIDALFCATSGHAGFAHAMCPPGDYCFKVLADGYVVVSRPAARLLSTGETYEFIMEPLVGVVARSDHGPITSWVLTEDADRLFRDPDPASQGDWMRHRARWRDRYPEEIVFLGLPTGSALDEFLEQEGRLRVAAFLPRIGWQHGFVTLRRLADIQNPEIMLSEEAPLGAACEVSLALRAPDGTTIRRGEIRVSTPSPLGHGQASFRVPLGSPVGLPSGEFSVLTQYGLSIDEIDRTFTVSAASREILIPLRSKSHYIGIHVRMPNDEPPYGALVEMYSGAGHIMIGMQDSGTHHWIPDGPVDLSIRSRGTAVWTKSAEIRDGVEEIRADLERDS